MDIIMPLTDKRIYPSKEDKSTPIIPASDKEREEITDIYKKAISDGLVKAIT